MATPNYTWNVQDVWQVVDGDTIDLKFDRGFYDSSIRRFRVKGVNCPEIHGPKAAVERPAGLLAKAYTTDWLNLQTGHILGVSHAITVTSYKTPGPTADASFGRWLGDINCTCGANLAADLIANGHGVPFMVDA
jgi:hypothetical protein